MPCLEITMPSVDADTRTHLASRLTEVFAKASGFPGDIFGIRFNEYKPGTVASGGKLWASGEARPFLHFLLYGLRLRRSVKRKLAASLTAVYSLPGAHVTVVDLPEVQLICMA